MDAHAELDEYSAANHKGEPGNLRVRQYCGDVPRNPGMCSRGDDDAGNLKAPVVDVIDLANLPQDVWGKDPRPEQLPENRRNP